MKESDLDQFIQHHLSLLNPNGVLHDNEELIKRACKFLEAAAILNGYRTELTDEHIKLKTVKEATFAKVMDRTEGKNAMEREARIDAHPEYVVAREEYESSDNHISSIKTYENIFMQAHVTFRQLAHEDKTS